MGYVLFVCPPCPVPPLLQSYTLFGAVVFLVSCYLCVEYHDVHSVVLEPASFQYSIYIGKSLITTQLLHNIYVRMQQERTGKC